MNSAVECFHLATLELVRSAPIKQRLVSAYRRHLAMLPFEQLPSEVRVSYGQVVQSLQGVEPMRGEDAVFASVRKMSNQEADDCAAQIVEIFRLMCRFNVSTARHATVIQLHTVDNGDFQLPLENFAVRADDYEVPALIVNN